MPTLTYIEFDGTEHTVNAELGISVMRGAIDHGVPGIDADCGGECSCATCHVIVNDEWMDVVGRPRGRRGGHAGSQPGTGDEFQALLSD